MFYLQNIPFKMNIRIAIWEDLKTYLPTKLPLTCNLLQNIQTVLDDKPYMMYG